MHTPPWPCTPVLYSVVRKLASLTSSDRSDSSPQASFLSFVVWLYNDADLFF